MVEKRVKLEKRGRLWGNPGIQGPALAEKKKKLTRRGRGIEKNRRSLSEKGGAPDARRKKELKRI